MNNKISIYIFFSFFYFLSWNCNGQKYVSIYDMGDSIVSCETNFANLFYNWNSNIVKNAEEYRLLSYSFVETITDSLRYLHYRNYFSGEDAFGAAYSVQTKENAEGFERFYKMRLKFPYPEIYDTRGCTERTKKILSDDIKSKAQSILSQKINVDTMEFKYYEYEHYRVDSSLNDVSRRHVKRKIAYTDSLSQNYIDYCIIGKDGVENLNITEAKELFLESLYLGKIKDQLFFNENVNIGDKVYVIKFMYNHKVYENYVICNPERKKVILDYFFSKVFYCID